MCTCNEPVPCKPCSSCDTPACNNACRYTGENIEGLGIFKNEDISTAIEKIAEFLLNNVAPVNDTIVKLSSLNSVVVSVAEEITNSSVLLGTTYQNPGQTAEFDVYYDGEVVFTQDCIVKIGFYKNSVLQGAIKTIQGLANTVIPFSYSLSEVGLNQSQSIDVRAVRENTGAELNNCTIKVVKR